jgi:hypothetical protein
MSSERQVYVLYSVESSSRILLPKVFGQCSSLDPGFKTEWPRFKKEVFTWRILNSNVLKLTDETWNSQYGSANGTLQYTHSGKGHFQAYIPS